MTQFVVMDAATKAVQTVQGKKTFNSRAELDAATIIAAEQGELKGRFIVCSREVSDWKQDSEIYLNSN